MDSSVTRRHFLSTSALAGSSALALLLLGRAAWAFSIGSKNAEAERLYAQSCGTQDGAYHRELVAEVKERLKGRATDAQIETAIAQMTCPICGCPITMG
jgi:hypothetical protein